MNSTQTCSVPSTHKNKICYTYILIWCLIFDETSWADKLTHLFVIYGVCWTMLSNHFNWSLSCRVVLWIFKSIRSFGSTCFALAQWFFSLYHKINMYSFLKCIIFVSCLVQVCWDCNQKWKHTLEALFKLSQVYAQDYSAVTCDFDLIEINASIAQYLPDECKGISSGSDIYNKMLEESLLFQEFDDQLNEYEAQLDTAYVTGSEDAVPEKQWALRFEIYNGAVPCGNRSDTQAAYVDCLIAERESMIIRLNDNISNTVIA